MVTKPKVSMIDANGQIGDVVSTGNGLTIEQTDPNIVTEPYHHVDNVAGVITLGIPGYPELKLHGLLTIRDIPEGKQGDIGFDGADGADGLNGRDGEEGAEGCIGPEGPSGRQGTRGQRGRKGVKGRKGDKGEKGDPGDPGTFNVFIQDTDPGPVGAGSLWVKRS